MENFDKFWYLLPKKDADAYFELRNYLENPGCETDIVRLFKTSTYRFILMNLLEYPYPMCQIVRCFSSSIYMQFFYEALIQFMSFTPEQIAANKFNFYSLLINAHVSDKWLEKCQNHVFNQLFQKIDNDSFHELPLVLLSSKSMPLVKAYSDFVKHAYETSPYTKRAAFFMATGRSTHFFEPFTQDNQEINEPDVIRNASRITKLSMLVSNKPTRPSNHFNFYDEVWKLFDQINPSKLSENQQIFYNEFARMLSLHHFVRSNRRYENLSDSIALKVLASKYNILDFFVKFNEGSMIINISDYHLVRKQLIENGKFNQLINSNIKKDKSKASEVNLYDLFYIIYVMVEVLLLRPVTRNYEDIVRKKCAEVKQIIDNIDDPFDYIEAIDILFTLLFLRWEHVNMRVFSNGKLENSTSATTEHDSESSIESTKRPTTQSHVKNGFACSFTVLKNLLSALSSSIVNRKFEDLDEELKQRFTCISNAVSDAKWRLQLVDLYYSATNYLRAPANLKLTLTSHYKQVFSKAVLSSSDESEISIPVPRNKSVIRRKPRRQKPSKSSKSSSSGKKSSKSSQTGKSDTFANSTEVEGKTKGAFDFGDLSVIRQSNFRDRRGFMTKMLGQLTDMVALCVIRGDFIAAKGIIESNNLLDTPIAREVQLLEKYNNLKSELKECIKTIPTIPCTNMTQDYSIEEIKNMIIVGFESSQVINLIQEFIWTHPIPETPETEVILERFAQNHMYLELYKGFALQGVIIIDYALSLNSNSDVCTNIINMLDRCWDRNDPIELFHDRIGYYGAIRHILSTLTLYNTNREQFISVQELLSSQLYTFNASEVSQKLQQESTFIKQKEVTLTMLSSRPGLIENIINFDVYGHRNENLLQNVFSYSMNMNRLIHFKRPFQMDANRTCLEEILEIDLFSLIGDIMFDENSNVQIKEIESIVCNLNTNLLHVITKNTCPAITIYDKFHLNPHNELNEILHLLTKNEENGDENGEIKRCHRKPFKIKRLDVLNYVQQHNELISYILGSVHAIESEHKEHAKMEINHNLLDNMMKMDELNVRMIADEDGNQMLGALSFDSFSLDLVRELIEQKKYYPALCILQYSPERLLRHHNQMIQQIKDTLITKILDDDDENDETKDFSLIEKIKDLQLMSCTLLKHINRISDDDLASHLIRTILLHSRMDEVSSDQIDELKKYLSDINLYANIGRAVTITDFTYDTWTKIMETSRIAPERLLHSLIERSQYELCHEWIKTISLQGVEIKQQFIDLLMDKITDNRDSHNEYFIKVCKVLLKNMVLQMDSNLLLKLKNRKLLQYIVDFLIEQTEPPNQVYSNYKITLKIFDIISAKDVNNLWDLAEMPLLIIEQYILNSKFETTSNILNEIQPLIKENNCEICNSSKNSAAIESNLERTIINYKDHTISIYCIDQILRTYAAKALDFRVFSGSVASDEPLPSRTLSLDSLCGTFSMPREAPDKSNWVKDNEATHCMCCKRSIFTMLTRRHHCRRCGRVVCHTCSTKRLTIPKLYENILVRVCDDCFRQTNEVQISADQAVVSTQTPVISTILETMERPISTRDEWVYRFTGNLKHDNLLREEFSFEYAPSASLCLGLISMHTPGQDCCDFLLNYCKKFEALLKPLKPGHSNPEVDYAFVTRILYCLSFAAKVHGGNSDCIKIREHAEIINSVVRNGCEALLPMESINIKSLRTLRDNLVVAEKFGLAIEISLKSGQQKTGIMAAWGIACIKAGCFETAREKLVHCLNRTTLDEDRRQIIHFLTTDEQTVKNQKPFSFKSLTRTAKVQPLLSEILQILETTCHPLNSDVLNKASSISQSNRSLSLIRFSKKEKYPMHEPAVNILHTLSNLKQISHGKYSVKTHRTLGLAGVENMNSLFASDSEQHGLHSRFYTESIYYLVSYGRHIDILRFLVKYKQITKALKYARFLLIPADQFIQTIIMPHLKSGRLNVIIQQMTDMDETLMMWKEYIIQICLMLEKRNLLNSLYQVQLLLKDTIRASMTCVRFYTIDCVTYIDLRNNSYHLMNAQQHLKSELELCQWEEIKNFKRTDENQSFVMKMDPKSLNQHINTIWLQIDASKFLANCEENGKETVSLIPKISLLPCTRIPTLFENTQDKIILVALVLICGSNVEEGFGLAFRIIQDLSLNCDKIYAIATKYLAVNNRLHDVEKLVNCIKSNTNQFDSKLCNEILSLAIQSALNNHNTPQRTKIAVENLIRLISDVSIQIDCHILSGQLKAAYLLAVQNKRVADIRRILRYAEKTNQIQIKKLCEKKLQSIDGTGSQSSVHQ